VAKTREGVQEEAQKSAEEVGVIHRLRGFDYERELTFLSLLLIFLIFFLVYTPLEVSVCTHSCRFRD